MISATNILCKTIKTVTLQRFLISANFLYGLFNIESLSRPNFNSKCNLYIDIDRKEILWGCCVSNLNFYADADVLDSISYFFWYISRHTIYYLHISNDYMKFSNVSIKINDDIFISSSQYIDLNKVSRVDIR